MNHITTVFIPLKCFDASLRIIRQKALNSISISADTIKGGFL